MNASKLILEIYDNPQDYRPYEAHCADNWRNLNHENRLVTLIERGIFPLSIVSRLTIMDLRVELLGSSLVDTNKLRHICWFTKFEYNNLLKQLYEQEATGNP